GATAARGRAGGSSPASPPPTTSPSARSRRCRRPRVWSPRASYDGGTTAARFVDFVRDELVPVLRKGRVVVMDNLAAHNDRRVDALVESAGCEVMRLPPYSPDFNPIENAISKVKAMLRTLARRTVPA